MGNGGSLCNNIGLKRQLTILVVGLDNSGKTSMSRALVGETLTDTVPTIGFSKFVTKQKGITINIYDLGGSSRIRDIWHNYFAECYGVVYVVDASDSQRLSEAHENLSSLMKHPILKGKPLLLLANKQDHFDALDEVDVADKLQLELLANVCQTPTRIEICCATQGTGKNIDPIIRIGFHWLVETIVRNFDKIDRRVTNDIASQKAKEDKEKDSRRARIERLKALQNEVEETVTQICVDPLNGIKNHFQPLEEITEEWNLPGSISETDRPQCMESPSGLTDLMSQAQIDQTEDLNGSEMTESGHIQNDFRGTISAPSEMTGSSSVRVPVLSRNDQVSSASPTAKKLNQRSNGKPLPPLTKNGKLSKQ
ncbi:ADP-ribosylation factor-like protein 13B isoform X1 [Daphnia magna]|uniref:ADP-ribosylation factor protein 13B n=2 Tax=Daphnia magna TaxID=35525 RepID=A0A0P5X7S3_9CRUS|nr:ADP-ribosylation factor-like protein 13B isoform X1 [Daphnia magna]XP_045027059.1 ADP-ribosylation factor-like protein 13B isoform X1 [Daphnia magna]KAK4005429.1 hypothetical protein OUZ56_007142 [Daphnia magna]KZS03033.1 GTP-binding protein SAR1b [Daphnia magna]